MKFVIQRVLNSSVKVDGVTIGAIDKGFMVLIGVCESDTKEIADKMVDKMIKLRIFEDSEGKTNLSLLASVKLMKALRLRRASLVRTLCAYLR